MKQFNWLIIYDISDSKRLQKVAKIMEQYGTRVQYSAFETYTTEYEIKKLRQKIRKIIDINRDYLVFFKLCQNDWQKQEKYGKNTISNIVKDFEIL